MRTIACAIRKQHAIRYAREAVAAVFEDLVHFQAEALKVTRR